MQKFLVTYDISNDKIRNNVAKILESFGSRVQFSVFFCSFKGNEFKNISNRLKKLIAKNDSIMFLPLSFSQIDSILFLGKRQEISNYSKITFL